MIMIDLVLGCLGVILFLFLLMLQCYGTARQCRRNMVAVKASLALIFCIRILFHGRACLVVSLGHRPCKCKDSLTALRWVT